MSVQKTVLIAVSVLAVSACSTTQESPIYQQSTKYKVHSPYEQTQQPAPVQYATYQTTQPTTQYVTHTTSSSPQAYHTSTTSSGQVVTTQVNHACLDKENDRKLIGTALGGAAGALAGNEIGDTKGAIIGAVAGGAAGYGIADVTTHCDPIEVAQPVQYQTYSQPAYTTSVPAQTLPAGMTLNEHGQIVHDSTTTQQMVYVEDGATGGGSNISQDVPQSSQQTYQAPTDSAYGDTFGTPGYHAMIANGELDETTSASVTTPEQPVTTPYAQAPAYQQPSAPSYQTAPAPVTSPAPTYTQAVPQQPLQQYAGNVTTHKVVEGDTVYSLSRRLCVDVEDIRRLNSLNQEFYIRLDDYIKLPASRC